MTLICCQELDRSGGRALLLAVDSVLSAGHRWPAGPKLFPIGPRTDCAVAFEGDTELAYPLLFNAINFIRYSDHLSNGTDTETGSVAMRLKRDIQAAYQGLLSDEYYGRGEWRCSFVFVGWSRLNAPLAYSIYEDSHGNWQIQDLEDPTNGDEFWKEHRACFVGHGDENPAEDARAKFQSGDTRDPLRAYRAFLSVVDDKQETSVGGMPQIALATSGGCEVIGISGEHGARYLLGHRVATGAIEQVRYLDRDLRELLSEDRDGWAS